MDKETRSGHSNLFQPVLVDGCRIPFLRSGTDYKSLMAYDLGRMVLSHLLARTGINVNKLDRVIMGNVIQDVNTSNVAREAALGAGIPDTVPAHTVTMACISSNLAVSQAVDLIRGGQARMVLAGGTETMSDIPIRFRKPFRQKLLEARKYRSFGDFLSFFKGLRPSHLLPDIPDIAEFSTGETMGESCDRMAAHFGVSRAEQDEYALRSHQLAHRAFEEGLLQGEVVPADIPPEYQTIKRDNGIRADSSMEQLSRLSPAFIKPHGTVTAGNASFLTDGASATLIMEEQAALEEGYKPKAYLKDYLFVAQDPGEELLLGPAYAIPKMLQRNGLKMDDIDVFELHEAFAGQVLAVQRALNSNTFAREKLGMDHKTGAIPPDKLNQWGGSLSIGHPFGATGSRLVTTASNRLLQEGGTLALVAACAAGGQGHAMLVKRYED